MSLPLPYFEELSDPDAEGWITVTFKAPAERFWIMLGAEKLSATERTTAYIDDISLRVGWIVDKKCPLSGSIYAIKSRYRFGFNGKENDSEVEGQQDYGLRIYDRRLGRFKSPDPLIVQNKMYPELSTYQFASNTSIAAIDLDGAEAEIVVHKIWQGSDGPIIETSTYRYNDIGWGSHEKYAKYGKKEYGKYGTMNVFEFVDHQQSFSLYKMTTTEKISKLWDEMIYQSDNPKAGYAFSSSIGQNGETKRSANSTMVNIDGFILNMLGVGDPIKMMSKIELLGLAQGAPKVSEFLLDMGKVSEILDHVLGATAIGIDAGELIQETQRSVIGVKKNMHIIEKVEYNNGGVEYDTLKHRGKSSDGTQRYQNDKNYNIQNPTK